MRVRDRMRKDLADALNKPLNLVKEQLVSGAHTDAYMRLTLLQAAGKARPSFVASELMRPDWNEKQDHNLLAWTAEALYSGGAGP